MISSILPAARAVLQGRSGTSLRPRRQTPYSPRQQVERAGAGAGIVISPSLKIVGYTIGNDMSSRDIEGENPLYLPQAKVYDRSCALGLS